jgi:hypothetical protein
VTKVLLFRLYLGLIDVLQVVSSLQHTDENEAFAGLKQRVLVAELFNQIHMTGQVFDASLHYYKYVDRDGFVG